MIDKTWRVSCYELHTGIKEITARGETKASVRLDSGLQADLQDFIRQVKAPFGGTNVTAGGTTGAWAAAANGLNSKTAAFSSGVTLASGAPTSGRSSWAMRAGSSPAGATTSARPAASGTVVRNFTKSAMVFQNYALYPHMTVRQNMGFSLKLASTPEAELTRRVQAAADILALGALLDRYPRHGRGRDDR